MPGAWVAVAACPTFLGQIPTLREVGAIGLVIAGVALHREAGEVADGHEAADPARPRFRVHHHPKGV
jgi:hypothetical protein